MAQMAAKATTSVERQPGSDHVPTVVDDLPTPTDL
jgi:hypothetical protein